MAVDLDSQLGDTLQIEQARQGFLTGEPVQAPYGHGVESSVPGVVEEIVQAFPPPGATGNVLVLGDHAVAFLLGPRPELQTLIGGVLLRRGHPDVDGNPGAHCRSALSLRQTVAMLTGILWRADKTAAMAAHPNPARARASISAWSMVRGGLPPGRGFESLTVGLYGADLRGSIIAYHVQEYVPVQDHAAPGLDAPAGLPASGPGSCPRRWRGLGPRRPTARRGDSGGS